MSSIEQRIVGRLPWEHDRSVQFAAWEEQVSLHVQETSVFSQGGAIRRPISRLELGRSLTDPSMQLEAQEAQLPAVPLAANSACHALVCTQQIEEVWRSIFEYLDPQDQASTLLVSRLWYQRVISLIRGKYLSYLGNCRRSLKLSPKGSEALVQLDQDTELLKSAAKLGALVEHFYQSELRMCTKMPLVSPSEIQPPMRFPRALALSLMKLERMTPPSQIALSLQGRRRVAGCALKILLCRHFEVGVNLMRRVEHLELKPWVFLEGLSVLLSQKQFLTALKMCDYIEEPQLLETSLYRLLRAVLYECSVRRKGQDRKKGDAARDAPFVRLERSEHSGCFDGETKGEIKALTTEMVNTLARSNKLVRISWVAPWCAPFFSFLHQAKKKFDSVVSNIEPEIYELLCRHALKQRDYLTFFNILPEIVSLEVQEELRSALKKQMPH